MMDRPDGKPEPFDADPEQLSRLLEIELMQKRAAWQRAGAQRTTVRALAFLFLFVVIAGALAAYFFFFADASVRPGERQEAQTTATPSR